MAPASSPRLMLVLAAACAAAPQPVAAQLVPVATPQIETVAGNGERGVGGDGDPATAARLFEPNFIAIDAEGDIYIAELSNAIRKVDISTGFITKAAGTYLGYSGDGGPATSAQLNSPFGVAVDAQKNFYITDTSNQRIRKVDGNTGIITTVAGTGTAGYSGDGGAATAAQLNGPYGITTDQSGNVYWTEYANYVVRKLDVETGTISTFAGTGSAGFSGDGGAATAAQFRAPWGLAFNAAGDLYIADATGTYRVRKVDAGTGIITTVAGNGTSGHSGDGGPGTAARVGSPDGLAVDAFGNLYISQFDEHVIRKLDARTGIITTIAGTGTEGYGGDGGPATAALFQHPAGLAFGPGYTDLYISDRRNDRIRKVGLFVFEPPAPNEPPLAVGSVDDVDLDPGATTWVSLAGLFTDEAPKGLTYAVSSSNPGAVAARLAGDAVELEGVAHGAATITVTATDTQDLSATLSFVVRSGMTVSFAADASAPEGGTIRLTLTANQPVPEALAVPYVLTTGGDAAADESDHAGGTGGTATFAAGATQAEIAVPVLDDDIVEPVREHFLATLAEPAEDAGYGLGLKPQATATIDEGVCDRDPAVRDELRRAQPCEAVADLSRWTSLRLRDAGMERLRGEDLLSLSGLLLLDVSGNRLPAFPAAALAALPNLWSLHLADNRIAALPAGLEHPALRLLDLSRNRLVALPANALSGFTGLRRLHLSANALAALPGDALASLGSLRALRLDGNALQTLPPGLFAGLGPLEELHLQGNPGAPFTLTAELIRTDAEPWAPGPASIAMRLDTGAPFTLRATLSTPDGAAVGEVSVPAGTIQGDPAEVADGGTPLTLTAVPEPLPDTVCEQGPLDFPCFSGFATAPGEPLTLYKAPPLATALPEQALDGDTLRLPLAERFDAAPGEAFTYAAQSSDPSVASVRVEAGVLVIEAEGDGEATVTVTATDAYGQTGTLTFTVRATLPMRGGLRGWRLILVEEPPSA